MDLILKAKKLRETKPASVIKEIFKNPYYLALRLEILNLIKRGAKTKAEALYLIINNLSEPLRCICGNFKSYTVSGKSEYPRLLCGACAKKALQLKMTDNKNIIGPDGLSTSQRAAYKAHKTKREKIDENGKNVHQLIAEKSADKKAIAMAKYVAQLYVKNPNSLAVLYVIYDEQIKAFKIGRSKNPAARICRIQKDIGRQVKVIFLGEDILFNIAKLEKALHEHLEEDNILQPKGIPGRTEWFSQSVDTELNSILEDLLPTIKTYYFRGTQNGFSIS